MTCTTAIQVHRYHDGELPDAERASLEAHLVECADCRELLSDLRRLSLLITSGSRMALPDDARVRLQETWRRARERSVVRLSSWLTAAAAAVLLFAVLTRPPDRGEVVSQQPGIWETMAAIPPGEVLEDGSADLVVMAQWMADELSPSGQR